MTEWVLLYLVGDRQYMMSTGPFDISPRDTVEVRFAILWARGSDHLDSVTALKKQTAIIRSIDASLYEPTEVTPEVLPAAPSHVLGFDQNFPNPFSESTTIRYSLPKTMQVRLAVYDPLGREVELLVEATQEAGIYAVDFVSRDLPAGLYLARIELDHLRFVKRMMLVR